MECPSDFKLIRVFIYSKNKQKQNIHLIGNPDDLTFAYIGLTYNVIVWYKATEMINGLYRDFFPFTVWKHLKSYKILKIKSEIKNTWHKTTVFL